MRLEPPGITWLRKNYEFAVGHRLSRQGKVIDGLVSDPQIWTGLLTLMALEIVLGIDNIVFISIPSSRLPSHAQTKARLWASHSP
jgi:hypothetical protein